MSLVNVVLKHDEPCQHEQWSKLSLPFLLVLIDQQSSKLRAEVLKKRESSPLAELIEWTVLVEIE